MTISQKCQYAVRAILELARSFGKGPIKVARIAARQDIPPRFLEAILNELRQGGFVQSLRGAQGGYLLLIPPDQITSERKCPPAAIRATPSSPPQRSPAAAKPSASPRRRRRRIR